MKIFVAGASGAIGQPLVAELIRQGHAVTGMTHSDAGAERLRKAGATVARVSAFDAAALEEELRRSSAEVVIDELTALPKDPSEMAAAAEGDRKLRLEGGGNLLRAARAMGVRRYIQQSTGFFLKAGSGLADEAESLAVDASPSVAAASRTYTELESRLFSDTGQERPQNRRRRLALRLLLRPEYLVQPRRRICRSGAETGEPDHRQRRGRVVVGPH